MSKETALVSVLALHTVTRPDDLGGLDTHTRGSIFEVEENELERLERVGAVRRSTKEEAKTVEKGGTVDIDGAATGGRPYSEIAAESKAQVKGEVADYAGQTTVGEHKHADTTKVAVKK